MNPTPSLAERYHLATKYTHESLRSHQTLDLRRQPPPFKPWGKGPRVVLQGRMGAQAEPDPGPLDALRLGRLLHHTYGVSRILQAEGQTLFLRTAPSAGGLYPVELYVATEGIDGIPDGLHAYQGAEHVLLPCWEGRFLRDLERFAFSPPGWSDARAVVIGTGFYERSSWRYFDRAYRRVLLDAGHVFGNLVLAAEADGLGAMLAPDFVDDGVDGLLLLDPAREGAVLLAAIGEGPSSSVPATRRSHALETQDQLEQGTWIAAIHRAGLLDAEAPAAQLARRGGVARGEAARGAIRLASTPLAGGAPVLEAIRQRRSTRAYRRTSLPLSDMGRILAHAHPQLGSGDPQVSLAPDLLDVHLAIAGVDGVVPGIYTYDPRGHAIVPRALGPVRAVLYEAALGQQLGRDAAFTVIHTFDLRAAVSRWGDRAYRTAHLEAGLLGQRLNLAALRLGHGASGIGGFLDDAVASFLALPAGHAVAYITTIGVPT